MDLTNIYNPYDFANPVSDANLLVGRMKEMDEIKYYLDNARMAPRPISIALLGRRASGKTSILNITQYEAEKRGFCTVRINLDEDDIRTQLIFFGKLFNAIFTEACERGAFGGISGKTYDAYLDAISSYTIVGESLFYPCLFPIQYAKAMSSGNVDAPISDHNLMKDLSKIREILSQPVLLLFDEGNVLSLNRVLLQKLRNTFMNTPGYMLVMTGTPDFFPVMDEVFSPIVRQFKKINVGEFDKVKDTLNCIRKPLEKLNIKIEEFFDFETFRDVLDIHNLAGGRPYEIQLICHVLFRRVQAKRAATMKLDFSVLDEVRRELETWQDITSRPILTNIRNLAKKQLEALSILCSCDNSATFDQIWSIKYIFEGEKIWTKEALNEEFQKFIGSSILILNNHNLISFAGDDFDRIYIKYFAREQGIALDFLHDSIEDFWRKELDKFIKICAKDQLEMLFDAFNRLLIKNGDVIELLQEFSTSEPSRDYFAELGITARSVYIMMAENQIYSEMPIITINPSFPWLNLQISYRVKEVTSEDVLDKVMDQVRGLGDHFTEAGGSLTLEKMRIPVIPLTILEKQVLRTSNEALRFSLVDYHMDKMFEAYNDPFARENALLHARISYQYDPEPSIIDSNNLGYIFLGGDELDQANILLNRAIDLCRSKPLGEDVEPFYPALPIYNRGILHAELGEFERALEDFQASINLAQNLSKEEREMGWLWVPAWNNEILTYEELDSPDLLNAAETAKAVINQKLARTREA